MTIFDHLENIGPNLVSYKRRQLDALLAATSGSGMPEMGMGFSGAGIQPPWSQNTPWATRQDTDGDGTPDALDHHYGPGVHPPGHGMGISGGGIQPPWNQNTPWAGKQDTDNDGIPDAMDNYFGQGINPPGHGFGEDQ